MHGAPNQLIGIAMNQKRFAMGLCMSIAPSSAQKLFVAGTWRFERKSGADCATAATDPQPYEVFS
jgi:hypothetical protein